MSAPANYENSKLCFRPISCKECHLYIFQCTGNPQNNRKTPTQQEGQQNGA